MLMQRPTVRQSRRRADRKSMDQAKFEDEMRALAVCVKCLDETKPRASLKWCTGCRMVLYCCSEHQRAHWGDHKAFCKARK